MREGYKRRADCTVHSHDQISAKSPAQIKASKCKIL